MNESKYITIISNGKKIVLCVDTILYVIMINKVAEIHVLGGNIYETRMTISQLEEKLGEGFIKANRGCLVAAIAIHEITDKIYLNNGESLIYTMRKKKQLLEDFLLNQKSIIRGFAKEGIPTSAEEYRNHYSSFENMPFAFADIEMIFNEESHAVDWIFKYGNEALARLEKIPLEKLIGRSFGSLFKNMDKKWLKSYERATLYGETLEIIDYSPEIDTYLKVICFPTFKGHCGCILFNISEIEFTKNSNTADKALLYYLGNFSR